MGLRPHSCGTTPAMNDLCRTLRSNWHWATRAEDTMGLLTFSINVTLDGCVDHQRESPTTRHTPSSPASWTRAVRCCGAASPTRCWRATGRRSPAATRRRRRRCASGRSSWRPSRSTWCRRRERTSRGPTATTSPASCARACRKLKDATPAGVLLGSGKLATELDRLDLIDEYEFLVHPRIAGHGPTLYQSGLPSTRRLELVSAKPLRSGAVAMHYRRAR